MSRVDSEETLKCDKEGYFDLDSLKPYSSVWVSTCRRERPKRDLAEDDTDTKKSVAPSRACNNLHTLLENVEATKQTPSEEFTKSCSQQIGSTKSEFLLNHYKFEKGDSASLKKIPDKIIESMCRSDSKPANEPEAINITCTIKGSTAMSKSKEDQLTSGAIPLHDAQQAKTNASNELCNKDVLDSCHGTKKLLRGQEGNDEVTNKEKEQNTTSYLGCMEHLDESKRFKLLSEHGKLVSELGITSLNLKDQSGREFPITVKYVWETDTAEVLKAALGNVLNTSQTFIKIIESVSSVGFKNKIVDQPNKAMKSDGELVIGVNESVRKPRMTNTFSHMNRVHASSMNIGKSEENNQNDAFESNKKKCESKFSNRKGLNCREISQNQIEKNVGKLRTKSNKGFVHLHSFKEMSSDSMVEPRTNIAEQLREASRLSIGKKEKWTDKRCHQSMQRIGINPFNERKAAQRSQIRPATYNKSLEQKTNTTLIRGIQRPPSEPQRKNTSRLSAINTAEDFIKEPDNAFRKKIYSSKFQGSQLYSKTIWK